MEKEINELNYQGVILDENTISKDDYLVGGDSPLSVALQNIHPDTPRYYYNQGKQRRTRNGCSNYAALGCVSDLTGYHFSIEDILDIHNLAEKEYGWGETWGNYLHRAVDCMRNWWNTKFPDNQIITFRVDLLSPEAQKLLDSGKSIMIGYHTSSEHYKDSQDNGVLDSESFVGAEKKGGHAIRINRDTNIDNYENLKKFNKYTNKHLVDYVKEGTYFRYGYIFMKKEKSIFKDLPKNHPFYQKIKYLYDKGIVKGYDDGTIRVNDTLSRGEFFVVIASLLQKQDTHNK